jgi:hypothetical protein
VPTALAWVSATSISEDRFQQKQTNSIAVALSTYRGWLTATPQTRMDSLGDTFGHADRAIATFEPTFWTVKRDYAWFVAEQGPNDCLTQVPLFRNFVNRVVNLKRAHSIALIKSVFCARF